MAALPGRAIQGMTGSGTAAGTCELGRIVVELRSVNGRGVAVRFRMPPECSGLEPWLDEALRSRIARGSLTIAIDIVEALPATAPRVDAVAFAAAAEQLRGLAREHLTDPEVRVADVLAVPGVLHDPTSDRQRTSWEPSAELAALLSMAADALVARRAHDGETTVAALRQQLDALGAEIEAVAVRRPEIVAMHRAATLERVREFLSEHGTQLEPADLIRELALFADRIDVTEEIDRLRAHLARLRGELGGPGPAGRAIEFLVQEVLREVNTLGSKSPDVETAHRVVTMKAAIDRVKEHAANLE